ncbi:MAG: hypothetical protein EOO36_18780 [Cytophagaceae bacterium]|nr:MAG: hypothetical protein EOO36_18780 [Cytophagaceae bacterium]
MQKLLPLLILLTTGCQKAADVAPESDELVVITQGRNRDCGVAQVLAIDSARVRQVVGRTAFAPVYLALQLDTALWVRGTHTLLVRIRKPQPQESVFCTALGLGYPSFVVTSARLQPGSK